MWNDNIYSRICCTLILAFVLVYYPFLIILVLVPIFYFGNYIEAIVLGGMLDALYGVHGSILYTSGVFVVFVMTELIKRRLRI
jgi:hypothetical protein